MSAIFYVGVTITLFVLKSPWPAGSFLEDILSRRRYVFGKFSIPIGVIGTLIDWYLLILPIPAVLAIQVPIAKKLGALIVFRTGGL